VSEPDRTATNRRFSDAAASSGGRYGAPGPGSHVAFKPCVRLRSRSPDRKETCRPVDRGKGRGNEKWCIAFREQRSGLTEESVSATLSCAAR
jgi:hypothetical protein